ncbi:IS3 family transposase [Streptomyces sp. NPDC051976]|uniref:IS3 family transposase n=1 Tax=Streptomyces sp. NPDC051976 TaxID=3154947 RepID=UPI0034243E22
MKTVARDFVSTHAEMFGIKRICRVLEVSRSGYYRWIAGAEARAGRQSEEDVLVAEIREIHAEHRGNHGALRVYAELRGFGHTINRKRVARLMRKHGIVGRHLRRKKRNHDRGPHRVVSPRETVTAPGATVGLGGLLPLPFTAPPDWLSRHPAVAAVFQAVQCSRSGCHGM